MSEQPPGPADAAVEPAPARASLPRRVWRLPRRLIARYIQFAAHHRLLGCLGCLGTLLVVLVLCGLVATGTRLLPGRGELAEYQEIPVNDVGTLIVASEDGVEQYIDGMTDFDAQTMWDAYAEEARSRMADQGASVDQLQQGMDQARARGARIDSARSLGSYPLRDGRRYVFYIVRRSGFPPNGGAEELYFVFTVDPQGKILNVV